MRQFKIELKTPIMCMCVWMFVQWIVHLFYEFIRIESITHSNLPISAQKSFKFRFYFSLVHFQQKTICSLIAVKIHVIARVNLLSFWFSWMCVCSRELRQQLYWHSNVLKCNNNNKCTHNGRQNVSKSNQKQCESCARSFVFKSFREKHRDRMSKHELSEKKQMFYCSIVSLFVFFFLLVSFWSVGIFAQTENVLFLTFCVLDETKKEETLTTNWHQSSHEKFGRTNWEQTKSRRRNNNREMNETIKINKTNVEKPSKMLLTTMQTENAIMRFRLNGKKNESKNWNEKWKWKWSKWVNEKQSENTENDESKTARKKNHDKNQTEKAELKRNDEDEFERAQMCVSALARLKSYKVFRTLVLTTVWCTQKVSFCLVFILRCCNKRRQLHCVLCIFEFR